jgi:hypothetical protein
VLAALFKRAAYHLLRLLESVVAAAAAVAQLLLLLRALRLHVRVL